MADPEFDIPRPSLLDAFGAKPDDPPPSSPNVGALMPAQRAGAIKCEIKRDEREVTHKIKNLAAQAGEHWYYRYPVQHRKKKTTEWIEGLTTKGANEVARIYGNCEVDTRVIDLGDTWLIMARFSDYESGFNMTRPYQQRKSQRFMGDDPGRAQDAALSMGVSKAIRNVITNSLQSFAEFAFDEAKGSIVARIGKELPRWRQRTIDAINAKPLDIKRAEAIVGRVAGEWTAPDVALLLAMMKGVADGMTTLDETFPPLGRPEESESEFANKDEDDDRLTK